MKTNNGLEEVARALRERTLRNQERRRIEEDLSVMADRIRCGEYRKARFHRNVLNITDRARELVDDLAFFDELAEVWAALLKGIPQNGTVLDIGCGPFPKVELGLRKAGFCGTATLVDLDKTALKQASQFLSFLNPDFRCRYVGKDVRQLRGSFDLVAANHLLDDLVLERYCRERGITVAQVYATEKRYRAVWDELGAAADTTGELAEELAKILARLVGPGGRIVLLDYPSHSHRSLKLTAPWRVARRLSADLVQSLTAHGFTGLADPISRIRALRKVKTSPRALIIMTRVTPMERGRPAR